MGRRNKEFERRSAAARKGWERRRDAEEFERRSAASRKGWEERKKKEKQPESKPAKIVKAKVHNYIALLDLLLQHSAGQISIRTGWYDAELSGAKSEGVLSAYREMRRAGDKFFATKYKKDESHYWRIQEPFTAYIHGRDRIEIAWPTE